ncbi:hypothetical protein DTO027B5_2983 [Paecilomyces variotii]|nr:hypothetical protein DTO027B3_6116 [Paecilomyces variotii]KAJ9335287.1 hypothetical protein DTO027B5_2983 [Paecilomyces variotii]
MTSNPPTEPPSSNASTATPTAPTSNLITIPPELETFREKLFHLDKHSPYTMSSAQFHHLFPFVDNMFTRNRVTPKADGRVVHYYWCRLWRKTERPTVPPEQRQRQRTSRKPQACPFKMKVQDNGVTVVIELTAGVHNHDYELMAHKATTAVRQLAAQEVAKGYKPAEVKKMLFNPQNGNREAILAAGGTKFNIQDIHNAAQVHAKRKQADVKLDEEIWPLPRRRFELHKILDGIQYAYYKIEAETANWPEALCDRAIKRWIQDVRQVTESIRRQGAEELRAQLRAEDRELLRESPQSSVAETTNIGRLDSRQT